MTTPPSFRDATGREWLLSINVHVARRIRDEVGIDVGQIADGKIFFELASNREKLAGTLWLLCQKQAEQPQPGRQAIAPEQFAELLDSDTLDLAMEALREAIVLFSPSHQRVAFRKMLEKTTVAEHRSAEAAANWIDLNAETLTTGAIDEAIMKATEKLGTSGIRSPN